MLPCASPPPFILFFFLFRYTPALGREVIVFSGERASKVVLADIGLTEGQKFVLEYEKGIPDRASKFHVKVVKITDGKHEEGERRPSRRISATLMRAFGSQVSL